MGEGGVTCSSCGAELSAGVRFCGKCGQAAPAAPAKASLPKKTMIAFEGVGAAPAPPAAKPESPAPETPAPASPAPASPAPASPALSDTLQSPVPAPPADAAAPTKGGAAAHAKTMIGLPAGLSPPQAPPGAAADGSSGLGTTSLGVAPEQRQQQIKPGAGPPAVRGANTMTGVPSSGPPPPAPSPVSPEPAAGPEPGSTPVAAGRTMLGLPGTVPGPAPVPTGAKPSSDIGGGRTMLGVGLSAPTASDRPPPDAGGGSGEAAAPADPSPAYPPERDTEEATIPPPASRGIALWVGVAVIVVLAIGVALWSRGGGESSVRAEVTRANGTEAMQFEVPGAPPGSKIRFGGQERELEAGRATFPLAADSLRVGDNAVIVDVVRPDGSVESARITLAVEFRIRVDLAPLKAGGSEVDVVVSALPGSKVVLDGEELPLDKGGKGVKRVKLDVAEGADRGHVDQKIAYRVEVPSGEVSVGEQVTRVPVTTMTIDRPGLELVTDRDSVEIAGAVEEGTTVTIDGAPVPVSEERFLHELPLPAPGEYKPVVVASLAGRVPTSRTLSIRRVDDLAAAAKGFEVDASLSYAKISQNPSIYKGQKAAFEGRIYAAKVQGGRSVLQMLVRECPKGRRCSLWITYPAATELTVDSWARVVGTLEGEQQFRSEADEVVTVPKISAAFLLPAKP